MRDDDCIELPGATLVEQAAAASEYPGHETHERFLRQFAQQAGEKLQKWLTWLNSRNAAARIPLQVQFCDGLVFGADTKLPPHGSNVHGIRISLGSLRYLLGTANRIVLGETLGGSADYFLEQAIEEWDPQANLIGMIHFEQPGRIPVTSLRVVDALVLMLLHEAAHARLGHLTPQWEASPQHRRAAETDADQCSGWTFVQGLADVEGLGRCDTAQLHRLRGAAMTHYVALQIGLGPARNNRYHLPRSRHVCAMNGGTRAWLASGCSSREMEAALNHYDQRIWEPLMYMSDHLRTWIGVDDSEADQQEMESVTLPLVAALREQGAAGLYSCC